ncbi:MAG: HPP family protein [Halobacteriaceae archaeon]
MLDPVRRRVSAAARRARRVERRELREFRRWIERTDNLIHLTVLLVVPVLVGAVTYVSNAVAQLSFLLFPPLASGTYTLFSDPEGRYSSPVRFVTGMTIGALSGWVALEVAALVYRTPPGSLEVEAGAAALGILLTSAVTWALGVELPTAFSTALLVLVIGIDQFEYVAGVFLSSTLVALVFVAWREQFYEERARYLYRTTGADDHVLVPMRGRSARQTAMFAARLAAPHDAGKVVLFDVVPGAEGTDVRADGGLAADLGSADAAERLEAHADRIETEVGVPCEVVVAAGDPDDARLALRVAAESNCDLVVTPYETEQGSLTTFVRDLFRADIDVVAFRSATGRTRWRRVMVAVAAAGDVAHAMVDYAQRLAGPTGSMSVCTCIDAERERRRAETTLANLVETVDARCETRISRATVEAFIARNQTSYDLVVVGASTNRSAASRFISRPTFERITDLETDVAVVHVG